VAQLISPIEGSLKNILIATDFSPASFAALTRVVPIARQFNSVVHIVYVIHPPEIDIAPAANSEIYRQVRVDAQRQLELLETAVGTVPHRKWLREGEVSAAVEDLVRSEQIDLVVVGTSGKSDLKKFFLGSTAEEILRTATCPVLTVGPHASSESSGVPLAQIVYVTKLWEESHDGLQYAIRLAIHSKSRLLLLHVIEQDEPQQSDYEWLKAYRRILRNLLPEYAGELLLEPVLRVEVAKNSTGRILQVADEVGADLIVMDVRPEEAWATHLRDKVYEIISCANCPVLTVRTKPEHDKTCHIGEQSGDSAVYALLRTANPGAVTEQFRGYGGTILSTTLSRDQQKKVENVLSGKAA
jgi:nucleotide-binding universal stress UspA family protein